MRFNSTDAPEDEDLTDIFGDPLIIELPENSFVLRLDGGIDFRIGTSELFTIGGIFVMEFSPDGFNVAIFDEVLINEGTPDEELGSKPPRSATGPTASRFSRPRCRA